MANKICLETIDHIHSFVKNFFIDVYEKFSVIVFEKEIPDTIVFVCYEPEFIPDGYFLKEEKRLTAEYIKEYKNADGEEIIYFQSTVFDKGRKMNTENAVTEEICGGLYVENDNTRMFVKSDGKYEYYFECDIKLTKEEFLRMAETVREKKADG